MAENTAENTEINWMEIARSNSSHLEELAWTIKSHAKAFEKTGNFHMGDELMEWAESVIQSSKAFDKIVSTVIDLRWKQAQESSTNILNAALAGITIQSREQEKDNAR